MEYVCRCDLFIVFFAVSLTTGFVWGEYVEVKTREANAVLYLVNPLGVQYAITIDDNGTITATEVT